MLRVNEIFTSLSGEPDGFCMQGCLATFIRLQGCNLDCTWCDTQKAADSTGGAEMEVADIVAQIETDHVIVTGGEPLRQREALQELLEKLVEKSCFISVETNGAQPLLKLQSRQRSFPVGPPVRYVVDYKLNSSGMTRFMRQGVFDSLTCFDVVKFVIVNVQDYEQAKVVLRENAHWLARIVFSPCMQMPVGELVGYELVQRFDDASALAGWMLRDKLAFITLALQLHKLVNLK